MLEGRWLAGVVTLISWDRPTNVIIAERQSGSCKANYLIISGPETVAGLCLHHTYVPLSFNTPNVEILEEWRASGILMIQIFATLSALLV